MSEPHRTPRIQLAPLRMDASSVKALDPEDLERQLRDAPGDAILLEWDLHDSDRPTGDGDLRGLYALLGAAARAQRVTFPTRWLPVRHLSADPSNPLEAPARLLAMARSDTALHRLFAEAAPALEGRGLARPDEPVVLLGVEGDALTVDADRDALQLRRRAEHWIHRLGADRVVLVAPPEAREDHPLVELARDRALPLMSLGVDASLPRACASTPVLWTDFQLDIEHRLPDDGQVPGLRDLLHRGALLRERTLYDRLPGNWRDRVDAELRALYAWHVSPLLRRVAALLQTVESVDGAELTSPLPQLRSVSGYLLGLSSQRPHDAVLAVEDPVESARRLAAALQSFDRRIHAQVEAQAWPRLHARLAAWSEGGLLAACDGGGEFERVFCFSGQALGHRAPLRRGSDGMARIDLDAADRKALGWFSLTCTLQPARFNPASSGSGVDVDASSVSKVEPAPVLDLPLVDAQLALSLDDAFPYEENTA